MSADSDTLKGFKVKWDATAGITSVVTGGLESGRLASTEANSPGTARRMPYAVAMCVAFADPLFHTGGESVWDERHLTLEVYGVGEANVGSIMSTIKATFTRDVAMTIDNATFKVMQPVGADDGLELDPTKKSGEDVWIGRAGWIIKAVRTAQ